MSLFSIGTAGLSRVGHTNVVTSEAEDWFDEEMGQMPSIFENIPDPDPPSPVTEVSFIFCTG